jgi:tRNA-binding protein
MCKGFLLYKEKNMIDYADFSKVDIRVGKIVAVEDFPEAKKPAHKLTIDFGPEIGQKRSSAQVKKYYSKETLINKLVLGVVNFPPKQIGPFMSECLTLGAPDEEGQCVLISPNNNNAIIGGKLF